MKAILSLLCVLVFTGAGCSVTSLDAEKTASVTSTGAQSPLQSHVVTMDISKWKRYATNSGLELYYPPELYVEDGGDVDHGSYTWIKANDREYFRLFTHAPSKCKFSDPAKCNIGTMVPATVHEVFVRVVKDLNDSGSFASSTDVRVGGVTGKRFVRREEGLGDVPSVIVIIPATKRVFQVDSMYTADGDAQLFEKFLSTFRVK